MAKLLFRPVLSRLCCEMHRFKNSADMRVVTSVAVTIRLFTARFLCVATLFSTSLTLANEFAADSSSILKQLSVPSNTVGESGNFVRKGAFESAAPDPSSKIDVIQEVETAGSLTRNFTVVERQETAPRANLRIEFDVDSARLRSQSVPVLQSLAQALRSQTLENASILINGHTDSTGDDQHNLDLSFRRAQAVRKYLVSAVGISSNRLKVQGFGEGAPWVNNNTAANRQLNRRVEIERVQ